jgi:protein-tyrosine kinase
MSTIERAAELLRAASSRQQPAAAAEPTPALEPGAIERLAEASRPARQVAGPPSHTAGATTRLLKIERNRLRQQSMITPDGERTPVAESFRRIKRQILANLAAPAKPDAPPANLVMVTSALAGEGKTYCAINLAISIALEVDRTVLLVDADVAKADVAAALGLSAERGLMDVLTDRSIDLADVMWKADIGRLSVLPVGTRHKNATELLASDAMHALLRGMAQRYRDRVIVFDSAPLLAASEAAALASQMGQIVVVVEAGRTSDAALKDALAHVDADRVAGLLLNKVTGSALPYGYDAYG